MNNYLTGLIRLLFFIAVSGLPLSAQTQPVPSAPSKIGPCVAKSEYQQFDFWVGEWEVTDKAKKIADSSIQRVVDGCIVLENYLQLDGYSGKSLNFFDAVLGKWRQTWVDRIGSVSEFVGEYKDGACVLQEKSTVRTAIRHKFA